MTDDKWEQVKDMIEDKFGDVKIEKKQGEDGIGEVERVFFKGPMGKMKLERVVRPRLVGKKTLTSRRIGADVKEEKVYDENDLVSFIKAYKVGDDNDWAEIEFPME